MYDTDLVPTIIAVFHLNLLKNLTTKFATLLAVTDVLTIVEQQSLSCLTSKFETLLIQQNK